MSEKNLTIYKVDKELIKHPAYMFYGRVSGDSMKDADLSDGDILIIDKSLELQTRDMVVCYIDGCSRF